MTPTPAKQGLGAVLKAEGYSIINSPGERAIEHDTFTCGHCNFITFTKGIGSKMQVVVIQNDQSVTVKDAGFCRKCWRYICPRCENFDCTPLEAKLDAEEKQARKLILP